MPQKAAPATTLQDLDDLDIIGASAGLVRPLEEDDDTRDNIRGRFYLLWAIQKHWPEFWYGLKAEVFDPHHPFGKEHVEQTASALFGYLSRIGLEDQWIAEACWHTLLGWVRLPAEKLFTSDHQVWFAYASNEPVLPVFEVSVRDRPRYKKSVAGSLAARRAIDAFCDDETMETPAEFKKRISDEFATCLNAYVSYLEARTSKRVVMRDHAAWTALAMSGKSYAEIAAGWPSLHVIAKATGKPRVDHPYETVKQAIFRFTREIGIALPSVTRKTPKASYRQNG